MEFHGTFLGKIKSSMEFHGIPWNSGVWKKFHGIPWNFGSGQNSMEFHGIPWNHRCCSNVVQKVPWNCSSHRNWRTQSSTEFHGTACVSEIGLLLVPWNSMELFVSLKLAYSKFHGIPWNCFCQRNWRTPSSMEFHGTARVIEIGALEVPWNSMELLVSWNLFLLFNGTIGIINALSVKMV